MNAQTNKIQADADGNLFLQLPADLVKDLKLAQNDEIDIMPTAMGFEVRKITDIDDNFWDPFSETVNEYQKALELLKGEDTTDNETPDTK
ncbi:hypothetical protein AYR62_00940 [Secundilactobacillus paracollinoides]|uniref:SpoVT-AbrB domain-containing protein n=1 Tax=Secundilactobacillus paracollinoides TaxID=240427 RepID=A0A1B2IVG3_9LACO|nr:hypothetical protein [Secundilactobacillus paracollinoides]ANZ60240.1 hypothetical protein AYR61_01975 [Secundilactobacillus paracollinoides]ANZ62804.1 hypothetical protein AYR62_00940 [Secundilactobacillus paracollinoides]ANZ66035.1 hypothetical protein AYR63_01995 [Secundilactobacillus paracollinoides]KRL76740.1 hypothetical protein FC17_GL001634 [Secundilactobacillus paracollinoides DSM 15502 = JCM 11969]